MSRLFFALWPGQEIREQIDSVSRLLPTHSGRVIPRENWHITLAFLGNVNKDQQQALLQNIEQIEAQPFSLCIDRFGWWKKPEILWLAPSLLPAGLLSLVEKLKPVIQDCHLPVEERPYAPHISLIRKAKAPRVYPVFTPIPWNINEFSLLESRPVEAGVDYQVLKTWPLLS